MRDDVIIDLDTRWDLLEEPEPPPRRQRMRLRGIGALLVAVLCVVTLAAAGRPPAPPFTLLGFVLPPNSGDLRLVGGMILTHTSGQLVALEPDGRQRWAIGANTVNNNFLDYRMWQGNLLLELASVLDIDDPDNPAMYARSTVAIDPATGGERWRVDGTVRSIGDVVVVSDGVGRARYVYRSLPSDLLWTVPASVASVVNTKAGSLFAVTAEGVLIEYDLHTGAVRATGNVEVPHLELDESTPVLGGRHYDQLSLDVFDDRIVLRAQRFGEFSPIPTLTKVYDRMTFRPTTSAIEQFDAVFECGPVLCGYALSHVSILDASDFTELWRTPVGEYPYWIGSAFLLSSSGEEASRIVEARTGRVLMDLRKWIPVGDSEGVWLTRSESGRTYVALLRPSLAKLQIIGTLPFEFGRCQAEDNLVACMLSDGRFGVWRANLSSGLALPAGLG